MNKVTNKNAFHSTNAMLHNITGWLKITKDINVSQYTITV